jgi:hypothetical protein
VISETVTTKACFCFFAMALSKIEFRCRVSGWQVCLIRTLFSLRDLHGADAK